MTIERLKEAYSAQPFRPFVMHLADGRELPVLSREFISIAPSGRTTIVHQPGDNYNVVDLLLVTDLEFRVHENGQGKRRRRT